MRSITEINILSITPITVFKQFKLENICKFRNTLETSNTYKIKCLKIEIVIITFNKFVEINNK